MKCKLEILVENCVPRVDISVKIIECSINTYWQFNSFLLKGQQKLNFH